MESAKNTESLNEWEQIQLPTSREWEEMVIITNDNNQTEDKNLSIFPPSNHEGLQVASAVESPHGVVEIFQVKEGDEKENVIGKRFEVLRSGIALFVKRVQCYVVCGGGFWLAMAVVGVLASSMKRWRKGARVKKENSHLILQVKEKDQKISQLLLQIAQLNEMLSASRRVPVHRVG